MGVRVRIDSVIPSAAQLYQVEKHLCSILRVELQQVRHLLQRLPVLLPPAFDRDEGAALVATLAKYGVSASVVEMAAGAPAVCARHPLFFSVARCEKCEKPFCLFCQKGEHECATCAAKVKKRKGRQKVRVLVLLTVLFVVCLFAWKEMRRRSIAWDHPQRVAVILLTEPGQELAADLVQKFRARAPEVAGALQHQATRYLSSPLAPVSIEVLGPTPELAAPPAPPEQGILTLLRFNLALDDFAEQHDRALGLGSGEFDVRIYARVQNSGGEIEAVEGLGQQLGEIGVVKAQISEEGIDFAWFVLFHEFFHTRGATDKYGPSGDALDPEGLADPDQEPLYPQSRTEVMARGRPVSPGNEDLPGPPSTWVVGRWTAAEIGWK